MTEREQRLMERIAELRVELEQEKAEYSRLLKEHCGLKNAYWKLQQKHGFLMKRMGVKRNESDRRADVLL